VPTELGINLNPPLFEKNASYYGPRRLKTIAIAEEHLMRSAQPLVRITGTERQPPDLCPNLSFPKGNGQ